MNKLFIKCTCIPALLLLSGMAVAQDTFQVYFPLNSAKVDKQVYEHIDELVFKDKLIHGQKLIVLGYTDNVGGAGKRNDALSLERAERVRDYLVTMGMDKSDIKLCVGKGMIARADNGKDGYAADRKVQIIIDRTVVPRPMLPKPQLPPPVIQQQVAVAKPQQNPKLDAKLQVNQAVRLNNISFVGGLDEILPDSYPSLEELYDFMEGNPSVKIRIEGHVCCLGLTEGLDDRDLSYRRALAVGAYLQKHGIPEKRIICQGLGNRNPIVKEELTESDRILNRRVEIRIISK